MLAAFDKAFAEFEKDAYSCLHEYHFDPGVELQSFNIQIQAQSLAADIGYFSMVMRDLHETALREISDEMDRDNAEYNAYVKKRAAESGGNLLFDDEFFRNRPQRERKISIELAKLGAAFKCFLFLIRAYQDAIYKIVLCIEGQRTGRNSSMKDAIDPKTKSFDVKNPTGALLANAVSEYAEWFTSLKAWRDFIKYGAGISYTSGKNFVTGETTVAIQLHLKNTDAWPTISLDNVTGALSLSAKATRAVIDLGISRGKFKNKSKSSPS